MQRSPFLIGLLTLLLACGGPTANKPPSGTSHYGGVFNFNETQPLRSIFPPAITQVSEIHVASQIYEGLVRFNVQDLSVVPSLAESWTVDSTRVIYTFNLRPDVRFQDDPVFDDGEGRELTAEDVVRCFTALCRMDHGSQCSRTFRDRVLGGRVGPDEKAEVPGIQAPNDHTVRIILRKPCPNFLQSLADPGCWIYPHELIETYGQDLVDHAIGTGPFRIQATVTDEVIVLVRNEHYWGQDEQGDPLPYLDGVRITLVPDKEKEVAGFLQDHLSMITELSLESKEMLDDTLDGKTKTRRFNTMSVPALATQYYGFNSTRPPFNDVRVRRAFALAIDKSFLMDSILYGTAMKAEHGLVPPMLAGYPYGQVPGIPFDPDSARKLLAEAGYPEGKGFPRVRLQVNTDGFGYRQVAVKVQDMLWEELKVPISVSVVSPKEYYDRIERGEALFWREGWVADLPDPENFLALIYGRNAVMDTALPSPLNTTRYHNARFDSLYAASMTESDTSARLLDLAAAERCAMQDVPLIPLYHPCYILLSQPSVMDLRINPMELIDLRSVWFARPQEVVTVVPKKP